MADASLMGRVALVTGGELGIGAACVAELAAAGADVAVLYHSDADLAAASVAVATALGRRAVAVQADVGDEKSVEAAFDAAVAELGRVDVLVNSAGINMRGVEVADMDLAQWQGMLATDLTGSFLTCRRFVRDARRAKAAGAIVNITSIHSFAMRAGGADYDAAKGGQHNLTKTLALEVAKDGITVNAVAPGMILTPMNGRAVEDQKYRKSLEAGIPLGRAGTASEVAKLVRFLASPDGAYITGASITIDGGLSLEIGQKA